MADDTTFSFTVADGNGISSITWTESGTSGNGQTHTGTIAYTNGTSSTVTIKDGVKGDPGPSTYVWIKYSDNEPTSSSSLSDTPANWMGVYVGTSSTAPSSYTSYQWFKIKGDTGAAASLSMNTVKYQQGASGSTAPTGEWLDSIPTVSQGNYLWTKTTTAFNNGTPIVSYSSAYQGVDGQGVASTSTPLADVTGGAVGTSTAFARADHQHPKESLPYELSTSGEWTIRKWDDGTAECWCSHAFTFAQATAMGAWNAPLYTLALGQVSLPSGLFIARPVTTMGLQNSSSVSGWIYTTNTTGSTSATPYLNFCRGAAATIQAGESIIVDYFCVGRWKS